MEQLKFDTTGYRKYVDMSYRYANGAKNKGNNFQYGSLVDKTAMDAWLEEQNKHMTEDMRRVFGDLVASAGYYFDMQDGPKPGYIDVVVNTPDGTPDERLCKTTVCEPFWVKTGRQGNFPCAGCRHDAPRL